MKGGKILSPKEWMALRMILQAMECTHAPEGETMSVTRKHLAESIVTLRARVERELNRLRAVR